MKIIWLSNYRSFSLSSHLGLFALVVMLFIAVGAGFFGGRFYHEQAQFAAEKASVDGLIEETPQQKIRALASILAELQAKVITLQAIQAEVQKEISNKGGKKLSQNISLGKSTDSQGGRYVPADSPSASDLQKKNIESLLSLGRHSLQSAEDFNVFLHQLRYQLLQRDNEAYFEPSFVPVHEGRLASTFGVRVDPINHTRAMHEGLDFAAPIGTPVYAAATGVVEKVIFSGDYGNHLTINHSHGYATLYAHNSKVLVVPGEIVQKGQIIAFVGNTGRTTGPHLHFEVHKNGTSVDPEDYLNLQIFQSTARFAFE